MLTTMDLLYEYWVGNPKPHLWPEYLKDIPMKGHASYAFQRGLSLGLCLMMEALYPEAQ